MMKASVSPPSRAHILLDVREKEQAFFRPLQPGLEEFLFVICVGIATHWAILGLSMLFGGSCAPVWDELYMYEYGIAWAHAATWIPTRRHGLFQYALVFYCNVMGSRGLDYTFLNMYARTKTNAAISLISSPTNLELIRVITDQKVHNLGIHISSQRADRTLFLSNGSQV